jgi:tetratricopeptide (TPR) repeat protein
MALYERAAADSADDPHRWLEVAEGYRRVGSLLEADWATEIDQVHRRLIPMLRGVVAVCPTSAPFRESVGHNLRFWAQHLQAKTGRLPEAETAYREAIQVFEGITVDFPTLPAGWHYLADSHRRLGRVLEDAKKAENAEAEYREAVAAHERRAARFPGMPEYQQEWSLSYFDLGAALYRTRKWKEAVAALEPTAARPDGENTVATAFFLAVSHWRLGHEDEARKWYDRAVEMARNEPQNAELRLIRAEAAALMGQGHK